MTITSLSGLGGTQQSQSVSNASAKLQAAIATILNTSTAQDVATVSIATQLQSQTSGLKQVSGNLAQASSLTQVADGGAEQIQGALTQLQSIASQARSPVLNDANRAQLNDQFQQIVNQVDALASGTSFNGKSLLDGSLSGSNSLSLDNLLSTNGSSSGGSSDLSVSSLSSSSLFGGQAPDVLSADNAGQALTTIGNALNQVTSTRASIGSFQQTVNYAAANVDSAITNQEAAQSSLSEADFTSASSQLKLTDVQRNASIALAAQTNRLNPQLLQQLIG